MIAIAAEIVKFILFLVIAVFIPGYVLVSKTKINSALEIVFLSLAFGMSLLTLVRYLALFMGVGWLVWIYAVAFLVYVFISKSYFNFSPDILRLDKYNLAVLLIILSGVIFQGVAMLKSGRIYNGSDIGFWGPLGRDGIWHQALTAELVDNFPPGNPGFAGEKLNNYHYFYNLLISLTHKYTRVSSLNLIYRFYPTLFSVLLGVGTYLLSRKLFKSKLVAALSVYLVYFGSSFGWMVEYIKRGSIWGGESTFWANQPVSFNLNPPFAISLVFLIAIILIFIKLLEKRSIITSLIFIVIAGAIVEFKVYAGVIVLGALIVVALKRIIFNRDFYLVRVTLLTLLVALAVYLPASFGSTSLIEVIPFWLPNTMIDAGDRVGITRFTALRYIYIGEKNWIKLILLEGFSVLIFIIGNLGTRVVGLAALVKAGKWRALFRDENLFILAMMSLALSLPLIFVQKGNTWNIVQFFYYFMFFTSLISAYSLGIIYKWLPKRLGVILIVVFVVLTPISSIATFRSWLYPNPPTKLSGPESAALKFLSRGPRGIVLTHPYELNFREKFGDPYPLVVYAPSGYVSAFSGQAVFLEDVEQQIILGVDYKTRLFESQRFFIEDDLGWSTEFLKSNSIEYVYLPKIYFLPRAEQEYPMTKIFENKEVNIYKVLQ